MQDIYLTINDSDIVHMQSKCSLKCSEIYISAFFYCNRICNDIFLNERIFLIMENNVLFIHII